MSNENLRNVQPAAHRAAECLQIAEQLAESRQMTAPATGAAMSALIEDVRGEAGIAGPSGGTAEKPVGTVWMAARLGKEARALKRVVPGDRGEIRARAAQGALDLLRRLIADQR